MASRKRFIDAELFNDEWFVDLETKYKLAFIYLITNCGHDGIWKVSQKLLSFNVGENIEIVGLKRALGNRVVELDNGRLWFIPKFILFQYGDNLSRNNNTLKQFFLANDKYNLLKHLEGAGEPLLGGAMDKDKEKDKVKDKERVLMEELFFNSKYYNRLKNKLEVLDWIEWVNYRKEIKKKLTPRSAEMQLKFLSEQPNPLECIRQSIQNQWQGLFTLKGENGKQIGASPNELAEITAGRFKRQS